MQYSIVNLLDFSPWSFLTCSFFISILLGTRTGAPHPHHWLFPRRPPLPFSSCSTLEAAWRMYASSTFFVLRYVALHRFLSLVQPLKYINLIKKEMKEAMARPSGIFHFTCHNLHFAIWIYIFHSSLVASTILRRLPLKTRGYLTRLAHTVWRCSRSTLGGRLATTLVATISTVIFFFFLSQSSIFLIEGVLGSKNLFSKSGSKWAIT